MAFANRWYATNQIPQRAVLEGLLPLWGTMDPTDGGDTTRFSLSGRWSETDAHTASRVETYAIHSTFDLFSNHTYFLGNPVLGDQFRQFDRRTILGFNAQHGIEHDFFGFPLETRFGLQGRYDDIRVGLQDTWRRQPYETVRNDHVGEGSLVVWADTTLRWTPWLRTIAGARVDLYRASIGSLQDPFSAPRDPATGAPIWTGPFNSGSKSAALGSPKGGLVLGPFHDTEFFLNAGEGFHSTDARGTVQTFDTTDGSIVARIPLLVKSRGAEIGARTRAIENLQSAVSLFWLDFDSENQFSGDTGGTIFGRPSRRIGVEWTNHYAPYSWLSLDADLAVTKARFRGFDQQQSLVRLDLLGPDSVGYLTFYGNAPGNYLVNAPVVVASVALEVGEPTGWFGALRYRHFGPRALTEDGAFYSRVTGLLNARVGYRFENGWRVQLDAFNITNSRADQITYGYGSLSRADPLFGLCQNGVAPANVCGVGVMDYHFKPVEPAAVRLTVAGPF
jgi:hypothetical protein